MIFTEKLSRLGAHATVRHIATVLAGNVVGNGLNLAAMLLLAHSLDKGSLGIYGSIFLTMGMMAQMTDFGINTTIVKYYREAEEAGRPGEAEALLRGSLWVRLAAIGSVSILGVIFAAPLSALFFRKPEYAPMLRLACVGAVGSSLWMFSQGAMQSRRQFGRYAKLTTANHAIRLALICALILAGWMTFKSALVVVVAVPFIGAANALWLFPGEFWSARIDPERLRERAVTILHLSKWVFLSTIIVSITGWLNISLLNRLSTEAEAGQYTNAFQLAQGIHLLTAAISTVLLPQLALTRSRAKMLHAARVVVQSVPWIMIGVAVLIGVAHIGIPFLRHGEYTRSTWVFDLLAIGFSVGIVVNPLSFFCLAFERARWLTWLNVGQLVITWAAGIALIPRFGAIGAGMATVLMYGFSVGFMVVAFRRLVKMAE